jgi:hypothetical protein
MGNSVAIAYSSIRGIEALSWDISVSVGSVVCIEPGTGRQYMAIKGEKNEPRTDQA